jgi:thiamine monophosphate kinase
VGAKLYQDRIPTAGKRFSTHFPVSKQLQAAIDGGDDYELLFCVATKDSHRVPKQKFGIALTQIGEVTANRAIETCDASGNAKKLAPRGWDPF